MTALTLTLLALATATPLLLVPLRRVLADPVVPVAALACALLAAAAGLAAALDPVHGALRAVATVLAVAVAVSPGSSVVRAVFRLMRREFLPARLPADPAPEESERPEAVLRGGAWIGFLERGAVAVTLLAGFPEGIALVLAVKGVGRYAELRETNAPEAFIIGTFASVLWACAAAGTATSLAR